jgi:hypothetical protein
MRYRYMARRLVVVPSQIEQAAIAGKQGYRLRMEITEAEDMTDAVFRFRARPLQEGQEIPLADFEGVCTPGELESLAALEPPDDLDPPRFRLNYFDIIVGSQAIQDAAYTVILDELRALKAALNVLDTLVEGVPIEI